MSGDIQERMRALITQHGSVLAALAALQQHLEAQQNDEQTDSLENHVPHINIPAEFNQDTSESSSTIHSQILKQTTHSDAQLGIEAASNLVLLVLEYYI